MAAPVRIVLFDFDGTLVDSGAVIVAGLRTALADSGVDHSRFDHATLAAHIGVPLPRLFLELGVPAPDVHSAVARFQAHFRDHGADGTQPFDGAEELLADLADRGVTIGLATAKPQHTAVDVVSHLGWRHRFAVIAGARADETGGAKHEVIANALDQLAATTAGRPGVDEVVMVGDRAGDVAGARHHGIGAIAVTWGFGTRQELEGAAPAAIVDSMAELAGRLRGLTGVVDG